MRARYATDLLAGRCLVLLAAIVVTPTLSAQTDVVGMYLSWQRDPARTMIVNWVNLYENSTTNVWYKTVGGADWRQAGGRRHVAKPSVLQVRRVEITGLQPDTDYQFVVADQPPTDEKRLLRFRTMPERLERPIRFVTGGDMMHTREMADTMNRQAGRLDPDFALLGGDLAYADGVNATRWIDWLQSWTQLARGKNGRLIPMVVALGNHEVRGGYGGRLAEDAPYFHAFFPLPGGRTYYALDFGQYLSLLVMDSGHVQAIQGEQTEWLARVLAERAGQQFVFPCYHWPVYGTSKAPKGLLPADHPRSAEIRTNWVVHFERHGVSAVFENDNHNFKRTHPILHNVRNDAAGIVYLGDGAWGVETRTVPAENEAWYLAKAEPRRHLFHVTLHPDGQFEVEAVDGSGNVFDRVAFERARTRPVSP